MLVEAAEKVYGLVAGFVRCLVNQRKPARSGTRSRPDSKTTRSLSPTTPSTKLRIGRDVMAGLLLWPPNRRSRGSRTAPRAPRQIGWGASWPRRVIDRHARRLHGRARRIIIDLNPTVAAPRIVFSSADTCARASMGVVMRARCRGGRNVRSRPADAIGCVVHVRSGKARAAALTPERRSEIARNAAVARWR